MLNLQPFAILIGALVITKKIYLLLSVECYSKSNQVLVQKKKILKANYFSYVTAKIDAIISSDKGVK